MKYGLVSGCLSEDYRQVLRACGRIGFDGVELDVGADFEHNLLWSAAGRGEVKRLLAEGKLELASICLGTFWTYSFASPEAEVRARAAGFVRDTLRWCQELRAGVILVPVTPGAPGEGEEAPRRWIEELAKVAPAAEEAGVYLAVENVGRGCGKTAEALLGIVNGVNSPFVQVYYDFGNGLSLAGDPVGEIHALGKHIVQVHAKDPGGQYMGEGRLDIAAVAAALKAVGYDRWLVLETPETEDPPAAAARNLAFVREHI